MTSSSVSVRYCGAEAHMVRCAVAEGLFTVANTQTQTSAGQRITPSVSSCSVLGGTLVFPLFKQASWLKTAAAWMMSKLSPRPFCLSPIFLWCLSGTDAHLCALKQRRRLEGRVRKAIFILKDLSGDGIRDWVERYWLTPPRKSFHLFGQGCCHRDDHAIIEAGSPPSPLLQGHIQTLLFSIRYT